MCYVMYTIIFLCLNPNANWTEFSLWENDGEWKWTFDNAELCFYFPVKFC